ncbi:MULTISPECIES: DUF2118 domain-containing protein [Tissierellales]|jgi:biotin carboxyl carrier protein|uniref:DUF2118 domain-containing protein n=1 Tax=Acidilutibacter cellobiosedens TaxID=2507161 RepID=A0A410QF95_9FIRM|nr:MULTISPECIES: DUF2118 domain-containing protein [Tissierellales]MBE6082252.1 DUF2118 domain-containing protein [Tissierellaceae bacterium]QAT62743.1 DUF2118 domain-containing protein [Acidilutibacter cellobiosedens]SCL95322.1 Glutaconyl-CoA decarboxylase subunit gamma [Sporanaerobacter sp. PP17-6a]
MRKFLINVNGKKYEVEVEEVSNEVQYQSQPIQQKVVESSVQKQNPTEKEVSSEEDKKNISIAKGTEVVYAPMPGTILNINVKEGDIVKSGQTLIILEAMKMENEIVAPKDGKVTGIYVSKGATVKTEDKLVGIE